MVKNTDNREYGPVFKTLVGWVQSFEVGQRGKNRIRPGPALKGGTNRKARLGRGAVKFGRPAGTHRERHTPHIMEDVMSVTTAHAACVIKFFFLFFNQLPEDRICFFFQSSEKVTLLYRTGVVCIFFLKTVVCSFHLEISSCSKFPIGFA